MSTSLDLELSVVHEKLANYINTLATAPAQKSKEWYALKKITIGGSEVATVLGLNPFKSRRALIAEKAGLDIIPFNGNIATRWGNVFEPITKEYTELVLKMETSILEAGSIEGIIERQRYSPDGLGVVKLLTGTNTFDYFIVLFEFKAPYRSIPDGKVPKHYMSQPLTGMLSIPIAETSIFVNNCYRKCPISKINFEPTYDLVFHDGDVTKKLTKAQKISTVFGCGMICFYQTEIDYEAYLNYCGYGDDDSDADAETEVLDLELSKSDYDLDILVNSGEEPIDFGASKLYIIDRLLQLYEEKRIHAFYLPTILNNDAINEIEFIKLHKLTTYNSNNEPRKTLKSGYNKFIKFCDVNKWCPVGYLPWKLVKSDIVSIDSDENWQEKIKGPIKETLDIIDLITNSEYPQDVYDEMFPPKEGKVSKEDLADISADCSELFSKIDIDSDID
jgi:hypothetical protein